MGCNVKEFCEFAKKNSIDCCSNCLLEDPFNNQGCPVSCVKLVELRYNPPDIFKCQGPYAGRG